MKVIKEGGEKFYVFTPSEYRGVHYKKTFKWTIFNLLFKSLSHFLDDSVKEISFVANKSTDGVQK